MGPRLETTIIDDDGVIVVASESAPRAHYVDHSFDYEFPNALLEGMRAGEPFAWRTGSEGEHHVSVEIVSDDAFAESGSEGTPDHVLIIGEDDALLVLPYSRFTFGCDNGAEFDLRDGLGARTRVPATAYRVRVMCVGQNAERGSSFRLLLCASTIARPSSAIMDLPGWHDLRDMIVTSGFRCAEDE